MNRVLHRFSALSAAHRQVVDVMAMRDDRGPERERVGAAGEVVVESGELGAGSSRGQDRHGLGRRGDALEMVGELVDEGVAEGAEGLRSGVVGTP